MEQTFRVQGLVGQNFTSDGSSRDLRLSKSGALVTARAHSEFYETTSRGNIFSLALHVGTTAISAGNLINAAAAASTQFALWNPIGSGKNLNLLKFSVIVVSGTSPVTGIFHSGAVTAPSIATSVVTPIQNNLIGAAANCVAKAATHATGVTLTGGSALLTIRSASMGFSAGTFAALGGYGTTEKIDGDIVVAPGTMWVPTWQAAGTNMLVGYSITWEEVPIV